MSPFEHDEVQAMVISCIERVAGDFDESWSAEEGSAAPILADGGLSSLTVVAIMVEVEQELGEQLGRPVSLASDSLMSATNSPLATVGSFTDFVVGRVGAE